MKTSMIKRMLVMMFVLALVFAVYAPVAYGASPSPSPTDSASSSPSTSPEDSTQPTGSEQPEGSGQPDESPAVSGSVTGFQMLMLNDVGPGVIRVQMRLRDLGYFNYRPTGKYFSKTEKAVKDFQASNEGLDADGRVGEQTYAKLFSTSGLVRKPLSPSVAGSVTSGPALNGQAASYGELGDWAEINAAFPVGTTVEVTDFNKQDIKFNMTRTGGTNLATIEAATAEDYNKYLECFGGATNWEKRSVLVTIGGVSYAASLFGNPNGADTIEGNTMAGHTTLYFNNSTTDVSGFADKEDIKMVLRAANQLEQ